MRALTCILFFAIVLPARAQYRIAVDINSGLDNYFSSIFFCPVFKKKYYARIGLSKGNYGNGELNNQEGLVSPHSEVNEHPENPDLVLTMYQSKNRGAALEIGAGRLIELGPVHTIRFDLQWKGYLIDEKVTAYYSGPIVDTAAYRYRYEFDRNCMSIGPEIFHAIRMSARITLYYGVKLPYFLPIPTKNYKPMRRELTVGFQPNLAVGLSYAVQKSRRKREAAK
jgi:hypothetical protein